MDRKVVKLRSKDCCDVVWKQRKIKEPKDSSKREGYSFANSINWNQQEHLEINTSLVNAYLFLGKVTLYVRVCQ
jgi:hypothetical protein